jgi:hypothetical protein
MRSKMLAAATFLSCLPAVRCRVSACAGTTIADATCSTAGLFRYCAQRCHVVAQRHSYWHSSPPDRVITAAAAAGATYEGSGTTGRSN